MASHNDSGDHPVQSDEDCEVLSADHQKPPADQQATFTLSMDASAEQMNKHILDCNKDFMESIIKKVQSIKADHKNELNK